MRRQEEIKCELDASDDGLTVTLTMSKSTPITNRQALRALAGFVQVYLSELEQMADDATKEDANGQN